MYLLFMLELQEYSHHEYEQISILGDLVSHQMLVAYAVCDQVLVRVITLDDGFQWSLISFDDKSIFGFWIVAISFCLS